jgi:hypothetical protein
MLAQWLRAVKGASDRAERQMNTGVNAGLRAAFSFLTTLASSLSVAPSGIYYSHETPIFFLMARKLRELGKRM